MITGKRFDTTLDHISLKLTAQGTAVELVGAQKLLGVMVDQSLNFNEHMEPLCKKVPQRFAVLRKIFTYW